MDPQGLIAQAGAAQAAGNLVEAERLYRAVLALQSAPEILVNYGNLLSRMGRREDALAQYDAALAGNPRLMPAHFNRANLLQDLGQPQAALESYDRAIALAPDVAGLWNNRGATLRALWRLDDALASFARVIALQPTHLNALTNRAIVLWDMKRFDAALAAVAEALRVGPDFGEALYVRANILNDLGRTAEALAGYERTLAMAPGHPHALNGLARMAQVLCDWRRTAALAPLLARAVAGGQATIQPFTLLGYSDDAALQRRCAETFIRRNLPPRPAMADAKPYGHDRIRLAYVSADFHAHATTVLIAELIARHDRTRFEVIGISFGPDDGSPLRARLVKAFDRFVDVRGQSDHAVAQAMREMEIDIAVDLNGHTMDARPGIFAWRPAPVQMNWLGYPGTSGAPWMDAVLGDAVALPFDQQPFFTETIRHLPHCYQPNDATRIVGAPPARAQAGLPEKGFVFCCFNSSFKLMAALFDIWMRLLAGVPDSVLWLLDGPARDNLRREAGARGIDPERLIFAPRLGMDAHLARHQLADLFLDTLPYNAHTTASDALWAGLPLVTCRGRAFPGRVAASLLTALEMPELIAETHEAYEALALALARDPARLAAVRAKLAEKRKAAPLFDSAAFCSNLEAAYAALVRR